jgi:colanic acid/amylovoran biosynthesis protein
VDPKRYRVAVFGASPDTNNMGVSALLVSLLAGLHEKLGNVEFIVFDNRLGIRRSQFIVGDTSLEIILCGVRVGKRFYRSENLATIKLLSKLGRLGAWLNPVIKLIDSCDAVVDVSAGDSFSDIYGIKRFNSILWPKIIAKNRGKQLIFAPQTYGPFSDRSVYEKSSSVTQAADMAWARDEHSFEILKQLLGNQFSADRHFCGVDMAFRLPVQDAKKKLSSEVLAIINQKSDTTPLVGINVSGLIYQNPEKAKEHYKFIVDYKTTLQLFIQKLLTISQANILLIPHVMDELGHYESDYAASVNLKSSLPESLQNRVMITPAQLNQSEVKWVISNLDWFCGTRMHSTIASLSSGVPTAAISYSDKTKGVFATCGQDTWVADPRKTSTEDIVDILIRCYQDRINIKEIMQSQIASVKDSADKQMHSIAEHIAQSKAIV